MRRLMLFAHCTRVADAAARFIGRDRASTARASFPEKIALPTGFAPEGIEIAHGDTFYVGSVQTGAIYTGSLRTGAGQILVPGAAAGHERRDRHRVRPRQAVGLRCGLRHGDASTTPGRARCSTTYQLGTAPATFINDVVVTRKAAYFTDSQQPVIYRVIALEARRSGRRHRRCR